MQDKYAGDTPDFGKFTLLRAVVGSDDVGPCFQLSVNWYYTVDVDPDHVAHGNQRGHTKNRHRFRFIDPYVWDHLAPIQGDRSVAALEASGVLPPNTVYYSTPVPVGRARSDWSMAGFTATRNTDVLFIDPDTGFEKQKMVQDEAPKYAYYSEISPHLAQGQTVVAYQHQPHKKLAPYVVNIADRIRGDAGFDGHVEAIKFGGGGSVIYFIMCAMDHCDVVTRRLGKLVERGQGEYTRIPAGPF